MTNTTPTDPALILAGIIRQVDGKHTLGAEALAEAILAHPGSRWGPALPVQTDADLEADFRAWFEAKHEYPYFGGIPLCDAIAWGKHLLQQCNSVPVPVSVSERPPQPPAAAVAWPEISDALIRRLVGDITTTAAETAEAACGGRHVNPIREVRARLLEVLELAAKDGAK